MRVTVLGSGTSTGVPVIGCDCAVCRSVAAANRRLRSSLYVEQGETRFLIDCSTDFRQQALRHALPRVDAVLMTHDHADHMNGIDDLRVYCFMQDSEIPVYAEKNVIETFRGRFAYCFNPIQLGGGVPRLDLREIRPGEPFALGALRVTPVAIKHGAIDILGFRLGNDFAYLTDCSAVPETSLALLEGVRVLVVGALKRTPHPTHFSLDEAVALSRRLGPERTWLTHIACPMGDHDATNAELPPDIQLLRDGQVLEI